MRNLADITLTQLDAQRSAATYAARPQVTPAAAAQDMAKRMLAAIEDGRTDEARELAISLRPLLGFLEDK